MPRIPIITAEGQAAVQQLPVHVPVQDYTGAYNFGQNLSEFSHQLNQIAHTLQKQRDTIDTTELVGIYHGKLKLESLNVRTEDPLEQGAKFAERMNLVREDLVSRAKNRNVAAGITEYINKHLPLATAEVHADAVKYMLQEDIAKVDAMAPSVSKMAAEASSPAERTGIMDYYLKDIDGLVKTRSITPGEGQNRKEHFRVRSEVDFARHLATIDYEAFKYQDEQHAFDNVPVRDLDTIRKQAESVQLQIQTKAEHALKDAMKHYGDSVERYFMTGFKDKTLSMSDIEEYKNFLPPKDLEHLYTQYRKMTLGIGGGDAQVQRETYIDYRNKDLDIDARIRSTNELFHRDLIAQEEWLHRRDNLDAEKVRQESEKRADQNSNESKMTTLLNKRDSNAKERLQGLFKTTGPFEQFNFAVATVQEQALRRYDQLSKASGGANDPEKAYDITKAEFLPLVPQRLNPLLQSLKDQLKKYPTKKSLEAARDTMSPFDFESLVMKQRELHHMEAYIEAARISGKLAPISQEPGR